MTRLISLISLWWRDQNWSFYSVSSHEFMTCKNLWSLKLIGIWGLCHHTVGTKIHGCNSLLSNTPDSDHQLIYERVPWTELRLTGSLRSVHCCLWACNIRKLYTHILNLEWTELRTTALTQLSCVIKTTQKQNCTDWGMHQNWASSVGKVNININKVNIRRRFCC